MKLFLKTLIFAFLLPLGSIDLQAQGTKYSIDNGSVSNSRSWKRAQRKYARAQRRKERMEARIRKKQKQREEEGRKAMIKRHLANQPKENRERLKKELQAESITYPEKEDKREAPKKKAKKLEL